MTRLYHPVDAVQQESLATSISHPQSTAFESLASASPQDLRQPAGRGGPKLVERKQRRGSFLLGAVASIASLVAVLALLALCRTSQRRLNSGGAIRRNLSDTEDEDRRSRIIDQCLELEEELGLRPVASPPSEEAGEGKAKLVTMLYESASTFEGMRVIASQKPEHEAHPPPPKIPRLSESWASDPHSQISAGAFLSHPSGLAMGGAATALDADAWVEDESGLGFGEGEHLWFATDQEGVAEYQHGVSASRGPPLPLSEEETFSRPSTHFSPGSADSGDYGVMPDAWLDEYLERFDAESLYQSVDDNAPRQPMVEATPAASTSTGSMGVLGDVADADRRTPRADVGQENAAQSTHMEAVQQPEQPEEAFAAALGSWRGPASASAASTTSSESGEPCGAAGIEKHPFVRLPVVNPKDIHRRFRSEFVLSLYYNDVSPMTSYVTMRSLFAKDSLTATEVETLMSEAELLANYAASKLSKPSKRSSASYIVRKMASLFMAFDYLVCTIEILGENMDTASWWEKFVQMFQTDYTFPEHTSLLKTQELNRLVNRLSDALAVYKQKKRPKFKEIISLKRTILTKFSKGSQFSHPSWQAWIQDDLNFSPSSGDCVTSSDSEADD